MKVKFRAVATAMLAAITVLALGFALTGCGPSTPSPTDVTKQALETFKKGDFAGLAQYYVGGAETDAIGSAVGSAFGDYATQYEEIQTEFTDEQKAIADKLLGMVEDFDYKISNEQINGDVALVKVEVTTYDFGSLATATIRDYLAQAMALAFTSGEEASQEQLTSMLMATVDKNMGDLGKKSRTGSFTVTLQKAKDGKWLISEVSDSVVDALLGGVITDISSLANSFLEPTGTATAA